MVATVHKLFPNRTAEPGLAAAGEPALPAVLEELRTVCSPLLETLIQQMLDKADDSLLAMSGKAASDDERRQRLDALRVLRLDRLPFLQIWARELRAGFDPAAAGQESQALDALEVATFDVDASEEIEERIAGSNLAKRVATMYRPQLAELEQRGLQMRNGGLQVPSRLLAPCLLCDAFSLAARQLKTELPVKLVVYKLFERALARDLGRIYEQALKVLDRHGCSLPRPVVAVRPALRDSARPWEALTPVDDPYACLAPARPAPASAARSLSETLHALAASGNAADWQATTARMTAANRLFDQALEQSTLAPALRGAFEPLRMPLVRSVLADPALLDHREHPTRRLLGELIGLSSQNDGGDFAPARFRGLLETALASQAENLAQGVAPALAAMIARLRELARERRAATLARIRREVTQDLELRLIGRELSPAVMTLLRAGIGPLMAMRLARGGRDCAAFQAADRLLDRLLASFDCIGLPDTAERAARSELQDDLRNSLLEIGLNEPRIEPLIEGLIASWAEHDGPLPDAVLAPLTELELPAPGARPPFASPPAPPPVEDLTGLTPAELLRRLLVPESWFRVLDPAQNQSRWLKLASHYANEDSVSFSGFDESTRQSMRASRLLDDLIDGRSEPINPSPTARAALDRLRELRQPPEA